MSTLWMVRHGPTGSKGMNGWTDIRADLSDSAALSRLSAALPDLPVVSSDLRRARETADAIIAQRPRLPDDEGLREMNFGTWEGKSFTEVWTLAPKIAQDFWDAPGDVRPDGGESWNMLHARVSKSIDRLLASHPEGVIAVVHFGAILTQVQRASGETAKQVFGRKLQYFSITEIQTQPEWQLRRIDHIV
ncbi:MAG: histidine phosphatase family protein [Pseudomonadota bacterium]